MTQVIMAESILSENERQGKFFTVFNTFNKI